MADITPTNQSCIVLRFRNTETISKQPLQIAEVMQ